MLRYMIQYYRLLLFYLAIINSMIMGLLLFLRLFLKKLKIGKSLIGVGKTYYI